MKRFLESLLIFLITFLGMAQDSLEVEYTYREDQFYLGVTYNLLLDAPVGVSQNNVSNGIFLGYIKDIAINRRHTKALGIGLGYNLNTYFTNLRAFEDNGQIGYAQISTLEFDKNRFTTHILEMPIEFRWRTSTPTEYKFWRIYGGVKLGYVFANNYVFESSEGKERFSNDNLRDFQYGLSLAAGYGTWNAYIYYGLNSLLEDDVRTIQGNEITMRDLKFGLIFYIL
ncbi:porin family protein [Sungkyunkwania multivorans]|uniref:Porin family protein n=1 Tax=Sungkyunkwania multivorans TaxID=1173618 RepID=A0ABW3CW60_9FLAO